MMATVFEEESQAVSDRYLDALLGRPHFWAIAAFAGGEIAGGLTAHTLPTTTSEASEIFVYDVAVGAAYRRRGVGRRLMAALREEAAAEGIPIVFVAADNEDLHALDFYRAIGGKPTLATVFTFGEDG